MCVESKRLIPFKFKELTTLQKQKMQTGMYVVHNFTNHAANNTGLSLWRHKYTGMEKSNE